MIIAAASLMVAILGGTVVEAFAPIPHTIPSSRQRQLWSTTTDNDAVLEAVNPRDQGLALQLDDGTRKSHSVAENTAFVSGFFKGLSTQESYRNLITSLYFVYQAMETSFDTTTEERVQALDGPELRRLASLEQDLEYFYGPDWTNQIQMSPATQAYVGRIQDIAQGTQPYLLIGHQYSRYLGDLFGGQMMGGMAMRSLDLTPGKGVQFYEFDQIPSAKEYISEWYQTLNQLDLTETEKQAIVDEANYCFALNIAIFEELEGSAWKAMWTLAFNTIKLKLGMSK
eukprot:CAMPEP_0172468328 /NCGR_PEP_ID=MMETSP1065-20121228/60999_1 /TAXON_ID=265537 /ORGANISM="Amphiprora paludosa, Strain CCMP125" /LENGTH=283 /DNA_ID=CAMNT_0013225691 /DNA_START=27 /DNA_END=876 /DNA_ORIENTATION=-